jgi:hypothetical protein
MNSPEELPHESILFHCPACGCKNCIGKVHGLIWYVLWFVVACETFIRGAACNKESQIAFKDRHVLATCNADQLVPYLIPPSTTAGKILALLSVLLVWVPGLGP